LITERKYASEIQRHNLGKERGGKGRGEKISLVMSKKEPSIGEVSRIHGGKKEGRKTIEERRKGGDFLRETPRNSFR